MGSGPLREGVAHGGSTVLPVAEFTRIQRIFMLVCWCWDVTCVSFKAFFFVVSSVKTNVK